MNKRIALDVFGGDLAPEMPIKGALLALEKMDRDMVLVGQEAIIKKELEKYSFDRDRIEIVHAPQIVETTDVPTVAIRQKKDSSLMVGLQLLKAEKVGAFISAGNTGAILAGATLHVGRIEGVLRPVLGATLPSKNGYTLLVDSGANMDAEARFLEQFALIGSLYMEHVMGIEKPRVGLLNVGTEAEKGNALTRSTYELLKKMNTIYFVGNVEARDVPKGVCDVLVTDGFAGNIILKHTEGMAETLMAMIKEALLSSQKSKIGAFLSKDAYKDIAKKFDYTEVGGAPFLGLKGLVIKAHGSSNDVAFKSAIERCNQFLERDLVTKISSALQKEAKQEI